MQLGEAKTEAEFPIIILYNKQKGKKKKASTEENYIPEIFLLKSPKLPECTVKPRYLKSCLAKLALKMTQKNKVVFLCVCQNKKYATCIEIKKKEKE